MSDPLSLSSLGLVAIVIVIFVALYFSIVHKGLRKELAQQQQQVQNLQRDLRSLCSAAVNVGERLGGIERESNQLSREQKILSQKQQQSKTTVQVASGEESSFDRALKLAKKGASAEEIAEFCNITRGEADLIAMMHRLEGEG